MKKFSFLFGVAFIATLALSSCKKEHTCECSYKDPITDNQVKTPYEFEKSSKKDADEACAALEATWKIADPAAKCELK